MVLLFDTTCCCDSLFSWFREIAEAHFAADEAASHEVTGRIDWAQ